MISIRGKYAFFYRRAPLLRDKNYTPPVIRNRCGFALHRNDGPRSDPRTLDRKMTTGGSVTRIENNVLERERVKHIENNVWEREREPAIRRQCMGARTRYTYRE